MTAINIRNVRVKKISSVVVIIVVALCSAITSAAITPNVSQDSNQCWSDAGDAYSILLQRESQLQEAQTKVNINVATEGELASLEGIGSKKAQEIILYREMMGSFTRVEELTQVKGIGDKTLAKNRHRLRVQ